MTSGTTTLGTQKRQSGLSVKTIAMLGLLCAISYVVMYLSKLLFAFFPVAGFLTFDLKDVVIAIGGFIFGPLSALVVSVIVSLLEMVTVSTTGPWGLLMNVLSTVAFVCPAAFLYKRRHTLKGAVGGLVIGAVLMTVVMIVWNYLITPIYMGVPRDVVVGMLIPTFLPFNLVKAFMNGALTMLLYKPVISGLRKARLIAPSQNTAGTKKKKLTLGVSILALVVLATCILLGLVLAGVL